MTKADDMSERKFLIRIVFTIVVLLTVTAVTCTISKDHDRLEYMQRCTAQGHDPRSCARAWVCANGGHCAVACDHKAGSCP